MAYVPAEYVCTSIYLSVSSTEYTERYIDVHTYSAGTYAMLNNYSAFTGNEDVTKVRISGVFRLSQFSGTEAEHIIYKYTNPENIYVNLRCLKSVIFIINFLPGK